MPAAPRVGQVGGRSVTYALIHALAVPRHDREMNEDTSFRTDLYRGTARDHDNFRLPYPSSLVDDPPLWKNLGVRKRALGWLLALLGFASLVPMLLLLLWLVIGFLNLGPPSSAPHIQIRGGTLAVMTGLPVTVLLFWSSARLLDSSHQERRKRL